MERLGGDWGSAVSDVMARQVPAGLLGIHANMPAIVPWMSRRPSTAAIQPPAAFEQRDTFYKKNTDGTAMMVTRPQTVGYGLSDSPAGLASWMYSGDEPERLLTKDEMLDAITLYWLTNTAISFARLTGRTMPITSMPWTSPSPRP